MTSRFGSGFVDEVAGADRARELAHAFAWSGSTLWPEIANSVRHATLAARGTARKTY